MASVLKSITLDDSNGSVTTWGSGNDLALSATGSNSIQGSFIAEKVWNSVWNDVADFQLLMGDLEYGKCYIDTIEGALIANERCQKSVIGIASDTFGFGVGQGRYPKEVPVAIAGWALAYVDKEYECGTPLTCNESGDLTEITIEEKRDYPERIVAIYKKKEVAETFGTEGQTINVNGRHWVKVK
ncbi:MAG: hypothetical protein BM556_13350 [Bacteriovorax sp. MedPE-SWde]|nr:MAG: hypothetical protein BM556_13350 [Bacteriovorax sp. MedPE-SWde]